MPFYHYTDRLSAADIRRDGILRAYPLTLHRDMFGRDRGKETVPVVWLTTAESPERTVTAKLVAAGWPLVAGDLVRFAIPDDYPGVTAFPGYHEPYLGCDPIWWDWALRTAVMAGSRWEDWRTVARDVPAADWLAVEDVI